MKIDIGLRGNDLRTLGAEAAACERAGVDGLWSHETGHDPFLPLLAAALATERVSLGTAIAVAFGRTPFALAQTAWDLQRASGGRCCSGSGRRCAPTSSAASPPSSTTRWRGSSTTSAACARSGTRSRTARARPTRAASTGSR